MFVDSAAGRLLKTIHALEQKGAEMVSHTIQDVYAGSTMHYVTGYDPAHPFPWPNPDPNNDPEKRQRIEYLTNQVEQTKYRQQQLDSRNNDLYNSINGWRSDMSYAQNQEYQYKNDISSIDSQLYNLQIEQYRIKDALRCNPSGPEHDRLETERYRVDDQMSTLNSKRSDDTYKVNDLDSKIRDLQSRIDGANNEMYNNNTELSGLRLKLEDYQRELERLRGW